ncbi:HAD-IA family hydrolase [Chitinivibrio alkaliphilus]|uniref:Haloacid dehalogenase-like hydrolase n=1 Tax=Chitinivibrio alkaliphilus ACht1 TaxID=1313304 RepID=U7D324_9BACT|nr:HAD-IA family hydrolase [Chitinivibrio alkaliphilus]ERP30894.1 Haloacid dehalogenase-like hydrolase [Chitinivibrio alkaliphilus ACht1]
MSRWVLFDFDGTIAESTDALLSFFNSHIYGRYSSQKLTADDFHTLRSLSLAEKIRFINVPFYKIPLLVRMCRKHFHTMIDDLHIVEGLEEACLSLRQQGYRLGIVSTNNRENIVNFLEQKGVSSLFSLVMCDSGPFLSVKHRTLRKFLRQENITGEAVVYVGDELRDILACRETAIPVVSVAWGWENRELLEKNNPGCVIEDTRELPGIIATLSTQNQLKHVPLSS